MGIILTEQCIIADVFLTGVVVEDLGDNIRLTGFSQHTLFHGTSRETEYQIVSKAVMSRATALHLAEAIMTGIGAGCCGEQKALKLTH
jgi:hypothetical protein